jgi:dephospho-CoA kinase
MNTTSSDPQVLRVGLTGGIATGKSLALAEFEKLGVYSINADRLAHQAIEKGTSAYGEVVREFGEGILDADGRIDRKKLGPIVFADSDRRRKLNAIVHPRVHEAEAQIVQKLVANHRRRPLVIMTDAALLIETGRYKQFDRMVVVFCSPELQLARLMGRDGLDEDEALRRIGSQMPGVEKIKYADYVIETSGTYAQTTSQVRQVYLSLIADAGGT